MIHNAALNVLKSVGCEIQDKRWLQVLAEAGAKVDFKNSRVFITDEDLISSSLESCGRNIKKLARDPKNDFILGNGTPKAHTPEGMTYIIDLKTKERRRSRISDLKELATICDALTNVEAIISPIVPEEAPPLFQSVLTMKILLENSSKPIIPGGTALNRVLPYIFQIQQAVAGTRDISEYSLGFGIFSTSPLKFSPDQLDVLWQSTEIGTPCSIGSAPQAGSTAPAHLAGMLTQFTAEILMGLFMGQTKRPGLGQYVYIRTYLINPRMGNLNASNPEVGLIQAAATQLFKEKYQLPVNAGWAVSDSHLAGPQATYEKAYTWLMTILARADMISGVGGLSSGLTASVSQAVIDNEIIGYLKRGFSGIVIDKLHLGVDMIQNIGIDETFLTHPKTGEILRTERWFSEISTHDTHEIWKKAGSLGLVEEADKLALEIIENHEVEPLDPNLQETLNRVVQDAKKHLI
ncbi:MAG: trimethylamine methyltransferase family protein [Candidatus Heimdallarchaeota archaeon]|nr:MAG: trimethylamine methyltransferase family protein [Candidatus Heimdallarchaeota archaeon]